MASPIYGTNLANYVNIIAGQARGQNEAERLRRMQENQNYSRNFQQIQFQDQVTSREQGRSDRYDWNAYNAGLKQQQLDQGYDWDVYKAGLGQEQLGYDRRRDTRSDLFKTAEGIRRSGYDPSDIYQQLIGGDQLRRLPAKAAPVRPGDVQKRVKERRFIRGLGEGAISGDPESIDDFNVATGANIGARPEVASPYGNALQSSGRFLSRNPVTSLFGRGSQIFANALYDRPLLEGQQPFFDYRSDEALDIENQNLIRDEQIRQATRRRR